MEVEKDLLDKSEGVSPKIVPGRKRKLKKKSSWEPRKQRGSMKRKYIALAVLVVLSCSVYLLIRSQSTEKASPTLRKVFIGFRHGSRGPNHSYKGDPFKNIIEFIPEGPGKLTKLGKQEAYGLGKRLRERYSEFLGPFYNSDEVTPYTTIMERSMMSGLLVLASFFPPTGYQIWDEDLKWQPVPIYPEYIFNASVGARCPNFLQNAINNLSKKYTLSPSVEETVNQVKNCSGESGRFLLIGFHMVWDTLYFQDKANLPIPDCFKSVYPEKMSSTAVDLITKLLTGTEVQRQLLLWNYAEALKNFFNSEEGKKMEIHSWHDFNNFAMLIMLGIDIKSYPAPTSCIAVELHERNGQNYFEAYYYESYKSKEPQQMEMACGMSCTLEELSKITEKLQVEDYMALCENATVSPILKKHFALLA